MPRLPNKNVLITAAGQGIGKACAELCAAEGANVLATDINAELLQGVAGCQTQVVDVLDSTAVTHLATQHQDFDVLVNCAGFVAHGNILDCDDEQFNFSIDLNVRATYRMCRTFLPQLLSKPTSSIVNIASAVSSTIAAPNRFVYGTTKAAIIGLTKSIAADFITDGLRCNAICPGTVASPSLEGRMQEMGKTLTGGYQAARAAFLARQPLGRLGTAEEIAYLVLYLASDESQYTTGTAQIIDGGWTNI